MNVIIYRWTLRSSVFLLAISAMFLLPEAMLAQDKFIIWKNGKAIGKVETYMQETAAGTWYALRVDMKTRLIATIHVQIQQLNLFDKANKLLEASFSKSINNGIQKKNAIKSNDGGYALIAEAHEAHQLAGNIEFSSLQLYFREPLNTRQIFSENHLQFLPIICIGKGVYKLTQPDGYITTYWFSNGVLKKVEGDSMFGKVQFIRS